MIFPVHLSFELLIYLIARLFFPVTYVDLLFISVTSLIDLDHITAKPMYDPNRNSFKHHFFHRHWKITSVVAVVLLFIRPVMFLGIGILVHFVLDYVENKIKKI